MTAPVVFLAFSNDQNAHLALLTRESKDVFTALRELDQQDFIKVHREESADIDELFDALVSFKDRLAVFHYGGHADGTTLRMEGGAAHAQGLAGLLGAQPNLKLVFLNGCATRPQVEMLLAAGVKAVIATSVPIRDDKATEFAARFYEALANRRTIGQAFALAQAYLQTKYGDVKEVGVVKMRDLGRADETELPPGDAIPWGLYVKESAESDVMMWKLPYYRATGLSQDMIQYIGTSFTATNRYVMLVLDEMTRYNPDVAAQMMEQRGGETVKRDSREYPELIVRNFPWPLGSQVRLLRLNDRPGLERLEHLVSTYVRTGQVLYYTMLSHMWEQVRLKKVTLTAPLTESVPSSRDAFLSFDWLTKAMALDAILDGQGVAPYVTEVERLAELWKDESGPLRKAQAWLEKLRADMTAGALATASSGDIEQRCLTAEQAVAAVLRAVAFYARYRMLTIRNISVDAPRFETVSYELDLGPLNAPDSSALSLYQDTAQRRKQRMTNSQSVVLVRTEADLDDGLNLSPFIVDKNTFVSVARGTTTDKDRLADIYLLGWREGERAVYLSVDVSIPFALANDRCRIHTDMTREDFVEGRNVLQGQQAMPAQSQQTQQVQQFADPFAFGATFEPAPAASAPTDGVRVFRLLKEQLASCLADLETSR
ncbi:MAG: CHAT domain-containing protein [Gemmatimonadaceae bacterium]